MQALVLAGQPNQGALRQVADCRWEAEIPLAGRPMLEYVLDALEASREVDAVVVVGPVGSRSGVHYVAAEAELWENLAAGFAALPEPSRPCLVVTADIPLITGPMIDEFIRRAPAHVDVVYPVVRREVAAARFPGTRRTYVRFREGTFTGGNLFWVRPTALLAVADRARTFFSHRKSPWRLASDLGWGVFWRLATGRLSLGELETVVGRLLGVSGKVLPFDYPEIGVDVDKVEDFRLIERAVKGAV
ncbi:MAG: NTP transferase domain-containing protein [Firmicutes bacterium]|nr:NTP transferase domain-containing protein [Alicyclobacillaceae bacterium]MCL6497219.1 NTP transferase domain-containing protein [Bacillota bacterium]